MDKCTRNGVRCGHRRPISAEGTPICNYLLDTGQLRHCPVGEECTHFTSVQFKTMDNWNDARNRAFEAAMKKREDPRTLGERLRLLRTERNRRQSTVAYDLEMSTENYSRYEHDRVNVKADFIVKICELYGVSADWLLGLSRERRR